MKLLFLLLVINQAHAISEIKTIDSSKYTFNVSHVTAKIFTPVKKDSLAYCIKQYEIKGQSSDKAFKICTEDED